jgi:hypothetical protein
VSKRELTPDPIDGTRAGWQWCQGCQAVKPPSHRHGDPVEKLSRDELLSLVRVLRAVGKRASGRRGKR